MPALLVIGSRNRKKRGVIVDILGDLGLDLRDLTSWPDAPEVVEDGATFAKNARKKAVEQARYLGQWVLGEDSGLVVPALNGLPGVRSARYAGKQGDDAVNNARLLAELAPLPDNRRAAYYVCTAALADPTGGVSWLNMDTRTCDSILGRPSAWLVWAVLAQVSWEVWAVLSKLLGDALTAEQSQALSTLGLLRILGPLVCSGGHDPSGIAQGIALAILGGFITCLGNIAYYAAVTVLQHMLALSHRMCF
jgi:non-canonical purine NTP pyrophosphatase (RdgB/HAM1 family)